MVTIFRVRPWSDFGYPATLAEGDQDGVRMFASALRSAHDTGQAVFDCRDGKQHRIEEQSGTADIEIDQHLVVWRFDKAKLSELIELVEPLTADNKSGHQYFDDMQSPTTTLVLSVNEYPADIFER